MLDSNVTKKPSEQVIKTLSDLKISDCVLAVPVVMYSHDEKSKKIFDGLGAGDFDTGTVTFENKKGQKAYFDTVGYSVDKGNPFLFVTMEESCFAERETDMPPLNDIDDIHDLKIEAFVNFADHINCDLEFDGIYLMNKETGIMLREIEFD